MGTLRILVAALALLPLAAAAREPGQGTIEVSGGSTLGFGSTQREVTTTVGGTESTSESDVTSMNVSGGVLYYLTSGGGVGLEVAYSSDETTAGSYARTVTSTAIVPKIAGSVLLAEDLSLFGELKVGYQAGSTDTRGSSTPGADGRVENAGLRYAVRGGVKWFPTQDVSLNLGLEYLVTRVTGDLPTGGEQTIRSAGLRGSAGVSVYFGR
jgi:opacity protein-like surface antigen